ncbi:hypothetical protein WA026_002948, partial [Henosepilachna vigintioctopunctata]
FDTTAYNLETSRTQTLPHQKLYTSGYRKCVLNVKKVMVMIWLMEQLRHFQCLFWHRDELRI